MQLKKINNIQRNQMAKLRTEGWSYGKIGKKFEVDPKTVYFHLKRLKNGFPLLDKKIANKKIKFTKNIDLAETIKQIKVKEKIKTYAELLQEQSSKKFIRNSVGKLIRVERA